MQEVLVDPPLPSFKGDGVVRLKTFPEEGFIDVLRSAPAFVPAGEIGDPNRRNDWLKLGE